MGLAESRFSRIIAWKIMGTPAGLKFIPPVSRLSVNVVRVLGQNPSPMTLQGTNTYLVGTGSERILIDTGEHGNKEYLNNLQSLLVEEKARIAQIILTHYHSDHTGGLPGILASGCTVERPKLWKFKRPGDTEGFNTEHVRDGACLSTEGASLKVIYTPGHTDDHVSLLLEEGNALFSGDCILGEGSSVFEHYSSYMRSLRVLSELKPAVIYPAHGSVIDSPVEAIQKYIDHRIHREEEILAALRRCYPTDAAIDHLVLEIYPKLNIVTRAGAHGNVLHHLQKLMEEKRVESCGKDRYRLLVQDDVIK